MESSFERANRLADESKADKWAACHERGQWWREVDWLAWVQAVSAVSRPTERSTMIGLWAQQFDKPARMLYIAPVPVYEERGVVHGMVWCTRCDEYQHPDAFSPDNRKHNGRQSWCKTCRNQYRVSVYKSA